MCVCVYICKRDSFGLRNTKECSMTYRQSETYSHKNASRTYHYSLFHPRGILKISLG